MWWNRKIIFNLSYPCYYKLICQKMWWGKNLSISACHVPRRACFTEPKPNFSNQLGLLSFFISVPLLINAKPTYRDIVDWTFGGWTFSWLGAWLSFVKLQPVLTILFYRINKWKFEFTMVYAKKNLGFAFVREDSYDKRIWGYISWFETKKNW